MPGTRYEDWHQLRAEGDQNAARDLIPLARKVLGFAVEHFALGKAVRRAGLFHLIFDFQGQIFVQIGFFHGRALQK